MTFNIENTTKHIAMISIVSALIAGAICLKNYGIFASLGWLFYGGLVALNYYHYLLEKKRFELDRVAMIQNIERDPGLSDEQEEDIIQALENYEV